MFNFKKNNLEIYRKKSKDRISIFGNSIEFDWIILVIFSLLSILVVFYLSINTFDRIKKFVPESKEEDSFLVEEQRVNKKIEKVLVDLKL